MSNYVQEVLDKLYDNPTNQDLDFFIEAYARIGYLEAQAQALADEAEGQYKFDKASAYAEARRNGAKSATDADVSAIIAAKDAYDRVTTANEKSKKVHNLLSAVEQAINAIKYLGRSTDVPMNLPRR